MNENNRAPRDIQPAPYPRKASAQATAQAGPAWFKGLLATLSVLALIISGTGWMTVGRLGNDLASASNLGLNEGRKQERGLDGATDILLVGSDSRTDAQGNQLPQEELARLNAGVDDGEENTDTMMVVRVPNDGSKATAVSIPRDTYIHDDEFGNMKINGVYSAHKSAREQELVDEAAAEGRSLNEADQQRITEAGIEAGRQGLLSAIADLTGVDIDHYAEVGLHGFVSLTNAVGGVDVCLNQPVDDPYSGAQFPAGTQTLDGYEALAFVRQRHGLPRGDIDRIVRQQAFTASLVNKVLSSDTLTSPAKLNDMARAVESSVVIDDDWDIVSFGTQMANLAAGNVVFTTIPVTSIDGVGDYGESIVTVDVNEVHSFMNDLLGPEEEPSPAEDGAAEDAGEAESGDAAASSHPALEDIYIHVLNATTSSGLAGSVGAWLEDEGLIVENVSNAMAGIYYSSQIVAADPSSPAAQALSELLGGLEITANASLDADTLIVVTHEDYTGPKSDEPLSEIATPQAAPVGTPGGDFEQSAADAINAGGDGPRCVN